MKLIKPVLLIFLLQGSFVSFSQNVDSVFQTATKIPAKYYSEVDKKINSFNGQLTKKSLNYLTKFQRQEKRIQQKLAKLNPGLVADNTSARYMQLFQKISSKSPNSSNASVSGEYSPYLDSLGTSLNFLKQFNGISDNVKGPLESFNQLQNKLKQSENIKAFIAERKNQIKGMLSRYTNLPAGLRNEYTKVNKTAYYYQAQVLEFKQALKEQDKTEQIALSILREAPAFQKFWQKNSYLAQIFPMPASYGSPQALNGLQTNAQVQALAALQLGSSATTAGNPTQYLQQQLNQAQNTLYNLKAKVTSLGGTSGTGDMVIPDFNPNPLKVKKFMQRMEYGFNIQNEAHTGFLPTTTDMALTMGYKFSNKVTAGTGISYKLGFGNGWEHLHLSSQGMGLRSFCDIKAKGSIWITGGWEYDFFNAFSKLSDLKNVNAWQKSALIGLKKKYKVGKRNGNLQLLYNLIAGQQVPRGQAFRFRIGFGF